MPIVIIVHFLFHDLPCNSVEANSPHGQSKSPVAASDKQDAIPTLDSLNVLANAKCKYSKIVIHVCTMFYFISRR